MKIKVKVHTNSKTKSIRKDMEGVFQVYTSQGPFEGKANEEIIKMLAGYFGVKQNQVFIESGKKSKEKIVEIVNK
jgi:uncharacterized protein (TIGR00251 family)